MNNSLLNKVLLEGEQVRWIGKAQNLVFLDEHNKRPLIIRWIICAVVALALTIPYVVYSLSIGVQLQYVILALFIGVPLWFVISPVLSFGRISRNAVYAVTNMRAIVCFSEMKVQSLEFSAIDALNLDMGKDGIGTLRIGSVMEDAKPGKYRILVEYGKSKGDEENLKKGLLFYHTSGLEQAYAMLSALTEGGAVNKAE